MRSPSDRDLARNAVEHVSVEEAVEREELVVAVRNAGSIASSALASRSGASESPTVHAAGTRPLSSTSSSAPTVRGSIWSRRRATRRSRSRGRSLHASEPRFARDDRCQRGVSRDPCEVVFHGCESMKSRAFALQHCELSCHAAARIRAVRAGDTREHRPFASHCSFRWEA